MKKYIVTVLGLMLAPAIALACPAKPPVATPTPAPSLPVLDITKGGPATVSVGGIATYNIIVRNLGSVNATNVVVTDFPPVGFVFESGSPECQPAGNTVKCTIASLPAGTNGQVTAKLLTLNFRITTADACPAPLNGAQITSLAPLMVNSKWVSQCVTAPTPTPNPTPEVKTGLSIEKTDNKDSINANGILHYEIKVTNTGNKDLQDIKVVDTVPSGLTIDKIHDGGAKEGKNVVWMINLGAGESTTLNLDLKTSTNKCGEVTNKVSADNSDNGITVSASDSTDIKCVKAAVVAPRPIAPVAVTARTGAGSLAMVVTLLGAAGLGVTRRLFS